MRLPTMSVTIGLAALVATAGFATPAFARPEPSWTTFDTGVDARLRGLAAVSRHVAWASGTGGAGAGPPERGPARGRGRPPRPAPPPPPGPPGGRPPPPAPAAPRGGGPAPPTPPPR